MYSCCHKTIKRTDKPLKCSQCEARYHLTCIASNDGGILDDKKWVCPSCIAAKPKIAKTDDTPLRSASSQKPDNALSNQTANAPNQMANASNQAGNAPNQAGNVTKIDSKDTLTMSDLQLFIKDQISGLKKDLESTFKNLISAEIKAIRDEVRDIASSMTFMNKDLEEIKKIINEHEKNLQSCTTVAADLVSTNNLIEKIEFDNNLRDQWARRSNVEICGVPVKKDENLFKVIEKISTHINYPINPATDIDFVTRVAPRNKESTKTKVIIVRFMSRYKKDDFVACARKFKKMKASDVGFEGSDSIIYFNDHLTTANKTLLHHAKSLANEHQYSYVWVKNCSIMVRRSDLSPIIHIKSASDLNKIK